MSLFGGPLPPHTPASAHDEEPYYRSSSLPLRSSPPHVSSPPLVVQDEPADSIERDPDDASDEHTDAESDGSDRPNRSKGHWFTYRKHIAQERDLTSSLAQLRAEDLGVHLYNAHALKRRAQSQKVAANAKPWQSKSRWIGKDNEEAWIPPRLWTAWPLEPSQVPRAHERFTAPPKIDPDDEFTIRGKNHEQQKPSRDMEDIFVGMVLKNAKERLIKREWENGTEAEATRARSTSRRSSRAASRVAGEDSQMDTDAEGRSREASASRAATPTGSRPTITTDDDKAHRILQPIVRSNLTKLDDLLTALHHSQQNHFGHFSSAAGNETETDAPRGRSSKRRKIDRSVGEGEPAAVRGRGRPPKPVLRAPAPDAADADGGNSSSTRKRKQSVGRPRKYLERLPGESHYMMVKRYEQLKAGGQPLPGSGGAERSNSRTTDPEPEPSTSNAPTPRGSSPAEDSHRRHRSDSTSSSEDGTESEQERSGRYGRHAIGLRDWSEVLGTAAMLGGFNPAVIERAAQRCAHLFGEGMAFRVLDEGTALERPGELVEYKPEMVPPPDVVESEGEDEEEEEDSDDGKPAWDGVSLACPHHDCSRHAEAYASRWRLREHVKRSHGYKLEAKSELRGVAEGKGKGRKTVNDEEEEATIQADTANEDVKAADLVGAVHNDGFMEPLAGRPGWRGKDAEKSEKRAIAIDKRSKSKSKSKRRAV